MNLTPEEQLAVFKRGAVDILPTDEALLERLREGRPLRVKLGVDPTAGDLHLGHTVPITKLRQVQDIGHQVIFLIGSFTACIGDPSGQSRTRPSLTEDEVMAHARTYTDQVWKLLDPKKTEVRYNHDWLRDMTMADVAKLLSRTTVARTLERDDFQKRLADGRPIHLHELLYSVMQGYDSVALKADVEIGGTDQVFNLLVGRDLQQHDGQKPQICLTLPLLRGTDGARKMSKSYGNAIGVTEDPKTMFNKILSLPDALTVEYFELLTATPLERVREIEAGLRDYFENPCDEHPFFPRRVKEELAREITLLHHGSADDVGKVELSAADLEDGEISVVQLLVRAGLAASNSDARRLIRQGGVRYGDQPVTEIDARVRPETGRRIRKGKKFVKELRVI